MSVHGPINGRLWLHATYTIRTPKPIRVALNVKHRQREQPPTSLLRSGSSVLVRRPAACVTAGKGAGARPPDRTISTVVGMLMERRHFQRSKADEWLLRYLRTEGREVVEVVTEIATAAE
jgi:hypothetical protein